MPVKEIAVSEYNINYNAHRYNIHCSGSVLRTVKYTAEDLCEDSLCSRPYTEVYGLCNDLQKAVPWRHFFPRKAGKIYTDKQHN